MPALRHCYKMLPLQPMRKCNAHRHEVVSLLFPRLQHAQLQGILKAAQLLPLLRMGQVWLLLLLLPCCCADLDGKLQQVLLRFAGWVPGAAGTLHCRQQAQRLLIGAICRRC